MSYAWQQLQSAVRALAASTDHRERLVGAYGKLLKLKPKDLPAEVVNDFSLLVGRIPRFPAKSIGREVRSAVNALTELQIMEAFDRILAMHDAVAVYQPQPHPLRHTDAMCRGSAAKPNRLGPAVHEMETRRGLFEPSRTGSAQKSPSRQLPQSAGIAA